MEAATITGVTLISQNNDNNDPVIIPAREGRERSPFPAVWLRRGDTDS